jgi:hypothetical protein
VLEGTTSDGAACIDNRQCTVGAACVPPYSAALQRRDSVALQCHTGQCERSGTAEVRCSMNFANAVQECNQGIWLGPRGSAGDPCNWGIYEGCKFGLVCPESGVCSKPLSPCKSNSDCAVPDYCTSGGQCLRRPAVGEPCLPGYEQCAPFTGCTGGAKPVCQPNGHVGQTCGEWDPDGAILECLEGYCDLRFGDLNYLKCLPKSKNGDSCSEGECADGLYCDLSPDRCAPCP